MEKVGHHTTCLAPAELWVAESLLIKPHEKIKISEPKWLPVSNKVTLKQVRLLFGPQVIQLA